jgi:hypothetical protein
MIEVQCVCIHLYKTSLRSAPAFKSTYQIGRQFAADLPDAREKHLPEWNSKSIVSKFSRVHPEDNSGAKKHSEGENSNPATREPNPWNVQLPEAQAETVNFLVIMAENLRGAVATGRKAFDGLI